MNNLFTYVVSLKKLRWDNIIYPRKWETNNKAGGLDEPHSAVDSQYKSQRNMKLLESKGTG